MKLLKKIILWSFLIGAVSCLLVLATKAMFFFDLFVICAIVLLIALAVLMFGGESIENNEAKSTYEDYTRTRNNSIYDLNEQITCSGKWHAMLSKDASKMLFIKTDAKDVKEYTIDDFFITNSVYDGNGMVAIDEKRKKLLLFNFDDKSPTHKVIAYADLLSVAVVTDGKMIFEKSTMRTIGGTLVGGALMGGAGAVVGGLSGSSTIGEKIGKVSVKFVLRDISEPSFEILFLNMMPIKPSDADYYKVERALRIATEIKDLTSIVIDEIDRSENAKTANTPQQSSSSVADELAKLADLKAKGILTEAEFDAQKSKLLSL